MQGEAEGEGEWAATEEEEAEVAEELGGGGLEIRQRKKGKMGRESEETVVNGENNSVYLEADKGVWKCRHCTWTYHLSGPGRDVVQKHESSCQVAMEVNKMLTQLGTYIDSPIKGEAHKFVSEKNPQNGISDNGAKEFDGHENAPVEEQNHNSRNAVTGNGSDSHLISEKVNANGSTRIENEIQEYKQLMSGESSKFVVEEFDVERVLEDQETHDLYCPNCHSCITKRVILRKRKRTPRENPSDLPPKKVHVPEASPIPTETADLEDRTVFRCLSCFSFFIPTEGSFNIFRIFAKRDGSANVQSSETKPARNVNWVSSLFGSGSSEKEGTEAGVPLPAKSNTVSSRDPSLEKKEYSPPIPTPGTAGLGEKRADSGMNNAGVPLPAESNTVSRRDPSLGKKEYSPPIPTPGTAGLGEKGANSGMNNAGVPLPAESSTVSTGDPSMGLKEFPPPIHTPGTADLGEIEAFYGMVNKGPSAGESYSNGEKIGNQTQGNKLDYTTQTLSEGNGIDKPGVTVKRPFLEGSSQINENINSFMPPAVGYVPPGEDFTKPVSMIKPTSPVGTTEGNQNIHGPAVETHINVGEHGIEESRRDTDWDVLKSIVYGGLIESITSLVVVSSAAGTGSSTLNICALGLANLIGGLFVIAHDLSELRSAYDAEATNRREEQAGRYWEKLGKREHFRRHVVFSILSYIIFGLLPPVIYGFAFRKSDNKEYKLVAVATSSLLCVALLAIGKAHVRPQKDYIKSLFYYLGIAMPASGLSYVAGVMIDRLLVELGVFVPDTPFPSAPASIELFRHGSGTSAYASLKDTH